MKRTATAILFFYLFLVMWVPSAEALKTTPVKHSYEPKVLSASAIAAIGTSIARADKVLVQSSINSIQLRGEFGESAMHIMMNSQGYSSLSPRFGSQGIDGIFLRYDSRGNPSSLIVGEAKYGSSRLGMTKDGWQLSDKWTNKRLFALSKRYKEVSSVKSVTSLKFPTQGKMPRHIIDVDLGNGQKAKFWRNDANDFWKYDGPPETLQQAQKKAGVTAEYLEGCSYGKIEYRKKLFQYKLEGNTLKVRVGDGIKLDTKGRTLITDSFKINLNDLKNAEYSKAVEKNLVKHLRGKYPHFSKAETVARAKEILREAADIQKGVEQAKFSMHKSLAVSTTRAGITGGLVVGVIDIIDQLINEGHINPSRVLKNSFMGFAGTAPGVLFGQENVILLTKSQLGYSASELLSSFLGLQSTSLATNMLGSLAGGAVTSIVMALGGSMLGLYDAGQACQIASAGAIGATGGLLLQNATLGIVSSYASASTGTAISSLGGAAASKATLAWLGGGSISSGGFGVVIGSLVIKSVWVVGAIIIIPVVQYGFHLYDKNEENKRMNLITDAIINDSVFLMKSVESCISD